MSNPLVGETNDGYLNDIRGRHITRENVFAAIKDAKGGPVEEGSVGAGTGTVAFGLKGGIGTASRRLPPAGAGAHGGCGLKQQRGLCDRVLDCSSDADTDRG
jgi:L-aminopeptidase/D-esterase-like protein